MKDIVIGVLALQGDFAKHIEVLHSLGVAVQEVRKAEDLEYCDGLIIPGGESTVILRQIAFAKMKEALCQFAQKKPLFGTCAGLILMSNKVQSTISMEPLGLLDVTVERNAFGRQVESFEAPIELHLDPHHPKFFRAYFIRAPRIRAYGPAVEILASLKGEPILIKQGHHLGASFHPELTTDSSVHEYFIRLIYQAKSD